MTITDCQTNSHVQLSIIQHWILHNFITAGNRGESEGEDVIITSPATKKAAGPSAPIVSDKDPAKGPSSALISAGPNQPDLKFPVPVIGGKSRSFNSIWYESFPWLEYSPTMDAAFCFTCRLYAKQMPGCAERAFISAGFRNWKREIP